MGDNRVCKCIYVTGVRSTRAPGFRDPGICVSQRILSAGRFAEENPRMVRGGYIEGVECTNEKQVTPSKRRLLQKGNR